jgi:hypothetical protein
LSNHFFKTPNRVSKPEIFRRGLRCLYLICVWVGSKGGQRFKTHPELFRKSAQSGTQAPGFITLGPRSSYRISLLLLLKANDIKLCLTFVKTRALIVQTPNQERRGPGWIPNPYPQYKTSPWLRACRRVKDRARLPGTPRHETARHGSQKKDAVLMISRPSVGACLPFQATVHKAPPRGLRRVRPRGHRRRGLCFLFRFGVFKHTPSQSSQFALLFIIGVLIHHTL